MVAARPGLDSGQIGRSARVGRRRRSRPADLPSRDRRDRRAGTARSSCCCPAAPSCSDPWAGSRPRGPRLAPIPEDAVYTGRPLLRRMGLHNDRTIHGRPPVRQHRNAKLAPAQRKLRVLRVRDEQWSITAAAQAAGVSRPTVDKWVRRFEADGDAGLEDRSSRPRRSAKADPPRASPTSPGLLVIPITSTAERARGLHSDAASPRLRSGVRLEMQSDVSPCCRWRGRVVAPLETCP